MQVEVTRMIRAPATAVWSILTDSRRLASGGFGITRIDGDIGAGARISLWSEAAKGRAFHLRVSTFDQPKRMVWTGGMPLWAFTGTRTFSLTPQDAGCRFHMCEVYSGWLMPLMARALPDLTPSFNTFADALKTAAERT